MSENIKNKYPLVSMRFKEAMSDKNITAQELSNKSTVGKASISHYVNGTHCPNNITAVKIADILEVSPAWLMGIESAPKIAPHQAMDVALRLSLYAELISTYKKLNANNIRELTRYAEYLYSTQSDS